MEIRITEMDKMYGSLIADTVESAKISELLDPCSLPFRVLYNMQVMHFNSLLLVGFNELQKRNLKDKYNIFCFQGVDKIEEIFKSDKEIEEFYMVDWEKSDCLNF